MRQRGLDGDEAGQVLVLGAQAVERPRAHAGADEGAGAGESLQQRGAMIHAFAHHRADDAQIVNATGDVREQRTDRNAALAVVLKFPGRFHQRTGIASGESQRTLDGQRLAVIAREPLLGIESIHAGRTAVHEQEDDALGRRREMRRARSHGTGRRAVAAVDFVRQAIRQDPEIRSRNRRRATWRGAWWAFRCGGINF